jgi:hypothetical protein
LYGESVGKKVSTDVVLKLLTKGLSFISRKLSDVGWYWFHSRIWLQNQDFFNDGLSLNGTELLIFKISTPAS